MATPIVSDLYLACRNGDMATVERLLPNIPIRSLNVLEPNGSTCLHAASYHGHKEIVRLLLAHGASRRTINRYGCTALDEAKTQEVADLFPRTTEAAKKRFSDSPAQQPEWQFEDGNAEDFSRAFHWDCIKDRGIKKTIKKLEKAHILDDDDESAAAIVKNYFDSAKEKNDPIYLLKAYTVESQFYRQLNREMATGTRRQVFKKICKKWTGYYTGIIGRNPAFEPYRFSGQTFRGMQITQSDFAQYKPNIVLANKSFQSTSKSWKIAKGFACPSNPIPGRLSVAIIFTITDRRSALSIEQISEYQNEEEVLIMPGTLFLVTNVNQNEMPYEVELLQLEWKNEF
jgi:hypothetical protein